jgi:hypothetical protein
MEDIKYVKDPSKFLRDSGLLFEINRQVLHPFGLALAVLEKPDSPSGEVAEILLWDYRDEKEGVVYGTDTFVSGITKLSDMLESFGVNKLEERKEELGYVVQEHPDPHLKKNGVILMTYNPSYNPDDEESPDVVVFRVPFEWLEKEVWDWFEWSVDTFLSEYIYDQVEPIYHKAKREDVVIEEEFIKDVR